MKPILFNTEMVRKILSGEKTVTRRKPFQMGHYTLLKGLYRDDQNRLCALFHKPEDYYAVKSVVATYSPGDILYVRETWAEWPDLFGEFPEYIYRANYSEEALKADDSTEEISSDFPACVKWRPSIHMPREAARIFLRVADVRMERLQEIDTYGTYAEGIPRCNIDPLCVGTCDKCMQQESPLHKFERLWGSAIKPKDRALYGWEANPWVWVIAFEQIDREEAMQNGA